MSERRSVMPGEKNRSLKKPDMSESLIDLLRNH